jgi:hypothetical protein
MLIELVVAMVVLAAMSVAIIGAILSSQAQGVSNRNRVAASNLGAREIDIVRDEFTKTKDSPATIANAGTVVNQHPLPGGTAGQPLVVDGTKYTVTRTVAWNPIGSGASACSGGSLVMYPTLIVQVSVTWPNMGAAKPVISTAQLAPRKDDNVSGTQSYVAVAVNAADGTKKSGVHVTASSTSETRTGVTDGSGCAVIQVNPPPAGIAYTASLSDVGFVDVNGIATPTKSIGTVGQGTLNNTASFSYDQSAAITLQFVDAATGAPVPAAALTSGIVTLVTTQATGASTTKQLPITGPSMLISSLFPAQYGAYYGTSAPPAGYTPISPKAGQSLTLNVPVTVTP